MHYKFLNAEEGVGKLLFQKFSNTLFDNYFSKVNEQIKYYVLEISNHKCCCAEGY